MNGKGSERRPAVIPPDEFRRRWQATFGREPLLPDQTRNCPICAGWGHIDAPKGRSKRYEVCPNRECTAGRVPRKEAA